MPELNEGGSQTAERADEGSSGGDLRSRVAELATTVTNRVFEAVFDKDPFLGRNPEAHGQLRGERGDRPPNADLRANRNTVMAGITEVNDALKVQRVPAVRVGLADGGEEGFSKRDWRVRMDAAPVEGHRMTDEQGAHVAGLLGRGGKEAEQHYARARFAATVNPDLTERKLARQLDIPRHIAKQAMANKFSSRDDPDVPRAVALYDGMYGGGRAARVGIIRGMDEAVAAASDSHDDYRAKQAIADGPDATDELRDAARLAAEKLARDDAAARAATGRYESLPDVAEAIRAGQAARDAYLVTRGGRDELR